MDDDNFNEGKAAKEWKGQQRNEGIRRFNQF